MTKIAGSRSVSQRYGSANPDPYQNVTDPQHCKQETILIYYYFKTIHTKSKISFEKYGTGTSIAYKREDIFFKL
jgi:hypothetical protein